MKTTAKASAPADRTVVLTMREDVARTVLALTGAIYGPSSTYRAHTDEVWEALQDALGRRVAESTSFSSRFVLRDGVVTGRHMGEVSK